jgi:hypothetical protein
MKLIKHEPLSNHQLLKIFNNDIKIVVYSDINKYKTLNDLFEKFNKIIFLYDFNNNYGHWCCLFKRKNEYSFFDSYGFYPDKAIKYVPKNYLMENYENCNYLIRLLENIAKKENVIISYNEYQFQSYSPNIQTCGYWCVHRLKNISLSVKEYHILFKNIKNKDNAIILLVSEYIN